MVDFWFFKRVPFDFNSKLVLLVVDLEFVYFWVTGYVTLNLGARELNTLFTIIVLSYLSVVSFWENFTVTSDVSFLVVPRIYKIGVS